jgi:hypothetical protein
LPGELIWTPSLPGRSMEEAEAEAKAEETAAPNRHEVELKVREEVLDHVAEEAVAMPASTEAGEDEEEEAEANTVTSSGPEVTLRLSLRERERGK